MTLSAPHFLSPTHKQMDHPAETTNRRLCRYLTPGKFDLVSADGFEELSAEGRELGRTLWRTLSFDLGCSAGNSSSACLCSPGSRSPRMTRFRWSFATLGNVAASGAWQSALVGGRHDCSIAGERTRFRSAAILNDLTRRRCIVVISPTFLALVHRSLVSGGLFVGQTDNPSYCLHPRSGADVLQFPRTH